MSYDIYLHADPKVCSACGRSDDYGPDLPDPTYNLTPIFDLALTNEPLPNPEVGEAGVVLLRQATDRPRGLRVLSGRKAGETFKQLSAAVCAVSDPARTAEFRALEPDNGWGDLKGAREVLTRLRDAAEQYPHRVWEIH